MSNTDRMIAENNRLQAIILDCLSAKKITPIEELNTLLQNELDYSEENVKSLLRYMSRLKKIQMSLNWKEVSIREA